MIQLNEVKSANFIILALRHLFGIVFWHFTRFFTSYLNVFVLDWISSRAYYINKNINIWMCGKKLTTYKFCLKWFATVMHLIVTFIYIMLYFALDVLIQLIYILYATFILLKSSKTRSVWNGIPITLGVINVYNVGT